MSNTECKSPGLPKQVAESKKTVYLSIDLDFWSKSIVDVGFLSTVINSVGAADVAAAIYHDSVLPHCRRYGEYCTSLINIDHHSDLGGLFEFYHYDHEDDKDARRLELHSGSWVDYVVWPDKKEFVWAYPSRECPTSRYRCDDFSFDDDVPFEEIPQREQKEYRWERLRCYHARPARYGIALEQVRAASIVLSPDYCGADAVEAFKAIVRKFGLEVLDLLPANIESLKRIRC